jgi:hypothetical protein
MEGAHPSDLGDQSTQGRSLDGACMDPSPGQGGGKIRSDFRKEETLRRYWTGMGVQGEEGRRGPHARGAESIEMPLKARRVCRIHQCTSPSSAHQLLLRATAEQASLHQHLEGGLFSSRSSDRIHEIPLGSIHQFTLTVVVSIKLTSCDNARSAEARSPYRILAVAYVLRLLRGLYSIPHYISAETQEREQVTNDTAIFRKSVKQGKLSFYPFYQSPHKDRTFINKSRTSI